MKYQFLLLTIIIFIVNFGFYSAIGKVFTPYPHIFYFGKNKPNYPGKYTGQEKQYDQNGRISSSTQSTSYGSETSMIRIRGLSGTYTSDSQELTSTTAIIIWDRLGIGQSVFKDKSSISGDIYDVENTLIELSYTFGDKFTLNFGGRAVTKGQLTITSSDSEIFNSSKVDGFGYSSILGYDFGIFEILVGFQYTNYLFTEFETASLSTNWADFQDSQELYVTGIGFAF